MNVQTESIRVNSLYNLNFIYVNLLNALSFIHSLTEWCHEVAETYKSIVFTCLCVSKALLIQPNVHLRPSLYSENFSTTASLLDPADGRYIHYRTATSRQWQRPLKLVPTAKITSRYQPVKQRLTNEVYKIQSFYCKRSLNLNRPVRHLPPFLLSPCFIVIF